MVDGKTEELQVALQGLLRMFHAQTDTLGSKLSVKRLCAFTFAIPLDPPFPYHENDTTLMIQMGPSCKPLGTQRGQVKQYIKNQTR